jgi:3-hydroxybutyryl-CoA dehydrogenase
MTAGGINIGMMTTPIRTVGVCGAGGTMGSGIAIVSARAGFTTICYDTSEAALKRARNQSEGFLQKSVDRGKMSAKDRDLLLARVQPSVDLAALAQCDLVIEAVFEDLTTKRELLARLDTECPSRTIFASNTSTLSITEIAAGCKRPDRFVGMHFCLPAQLMKLVEMSPGMLTSNEVFAAAWAWTEACGQIPVKTQDKPGFILNALLVPFNNDAIRAVDAGVATPADIDNAIKFGLGYKMGPLELVDLVGLDTQIRLCEAFYPVTHDPRAACPPLLRRMVAAGLLGRKSGQGFYSYKGSAMFGA